MKSQELTLQSAKLSLVYRSLNILASVLEESPQEHAKTIVLMLAAFRLRVFLQNKLYPDLEGLPNFQQLITSFDRVVRLVDTSEEYPEQDLRLSLQAAMARLSETIGDCSNLPDDVDSSLQKLLEPVQQRLDKNGQS